VRSPKDPTSPANRVSWTLLRAGSASATVPQAGGDCTQICRPRSPLKTGQHDRRQARTRPIHALILLCGADNATQGTARPYQADSGFEIAPMDLTQQGFKQTNRDHDLSDRCAGIALGSLEEVPPAFCTVAGSASSPTMPLRVIHLALRPSAVCRKN
jgi:hypothetical protein